MIDEEHTVLKDEVQLLGYGETDSYGPWVKFRLLDPADLAKFRSHQKGGANKTGQRYAIVLVEIGDDEQPVKQQTQTNYAYQCKQIFEHPLFTQFMKDQLLTEVAQSSLESLDEIALSYLGVSQKRELNADPDKALTFKRFQKSFYAYVRTYEGSDSHVQNHQ